MMQQPALMAAVLLAIAAAVTDARTRRIPNALVAAGFVAGLVLNGWTGGGTGIARSLAGGIVGLCLFLPFYLLRGMGGGDVKLMAALGACLGTIAVIQTAFVAAIAGALYAAVTAARHGALARTLSRAARLLGSWVTKGPRPSEELSLENPQALKIPYALPIAAGALLIVFSAS